VAADLWTILTAAIGFGAAGEGVRRYRQFKHDRRIIPRDVRNAGFWTDSRLYHAEVAVIAAAFAIPWCLFITLASINFIGWGYLATLGYVLTIYIVLRGLNATPPQ